MPETYLLKSNIHSSKNTIYGLKGDIVTKISDHGNVLIVEALSGERFPVYPSELLPIPLEFKPTPEPEKAPEPNIIITKPAAGITKKANPVVFKNQLNLF